MENDNDYYLSSEKERILVDPEEIIIEGFRRSRNRTNWLYRGTAMTTTDAMDIDKLRLEIIGYEIALAHRASVFFWYCDGCSFQNATKPILFAIETSN
jgi:hypothetical protein